MYSFGEMQSTAASLFPAYASIAASMMLFRSLANDIIPEPVKSFFSSTFTHFIKQVLGRFFRPGSGRMAMVVDQNCGLTRNQIYDAAEVYLPTLINPDTERVKVRRSPKQKNITLSMEKDQHIIDTFRGINLKWQFVLIEERNNNGNFQPEKRFFDLSFEKVHKDIILNEYLPFVIDRAKEIKEKEKLVKLYTRDYPCGGYDEDQGDGTWGCINLDHPITFDKLAMDPDLKNSIIQDLDRFLRRKEYYKKVGKAWKRGYLLYGPPGTGKSSLIAVMANYLKFDVYDLELTSLYSNSDLRRILLATNNRSMIVVEDIDCSAQMHDRDQIEHNESDNHNKLTLSGLLNFIDGLWSACGDERIVIFTTNHKDKLDPALLRPGRMDMHIHMGYCTPEAFDILTYNYLGINDHPGLFPEIKGLIREVEITPAEIAEHLMRNEDVDLALEGVLDLLMEKKEKKNEVGNDVKRKKTGENDGVENNEDNEGDENGEFCHEVDEEI